jgi:uncharacterized repeat protein (TIGR03843 family)
VKPAPAADALDLLARGELRPRGLIPGASNFTFLAEVEDGDRSVLAVYKPRAGETPLWDFPDGTLCSREVAAYLVARALGWPDVPPTVLRDGPHGEGSVQLYVDAAPGEHFFTLRDRYEDTFRSVAAFDLVVGNGDRKGGHCLLARDGRIWVVDHGLCFAARPWLRTVIWDFAGQPIPQALRTDLEALSEDLRTGALRGDLLALLSADEVDATSERARTLAASGRYPQPGPGRAHPWPAI